MSGRDTAEPAGMAEASIRRILVVEDDAGLRQLIVRALGKAGYAAEGVATGAEAVERATQDSSGVLLLDQKLPDMSGREIVTALDGRGIRVPFVMMTGQGDERLAVDMMKLGAADYLLKDTDLIDRLAGVMDRVFRMIETERRLATAEEALRESEQRFRSLFQDVAAVAVQGGGTDGTVRYWNHASERLYGYSAEEAIGRNVLDLILAPEERAAAEQELRRMGETGQALPARENERVRKDGTRVLVMSSHVVVRIPGHGPEVFCIDVDLTERERARRKMEEALARNTALLTANPDLMFLFDSEVRIVDFFTPDPKRDLYCAPEEFLNKPCREALPAEIAELTEERVREVLATGRPAFATYALGKTGPKHYESRYVKCGADQVLAFVRDITDRKRAEEEREKLQGQLNQAQKMESVGRLAGGVAHDFNNMLGVILGFTEMALESVPEGQPLRAGLLEIRKAAERSADLTRQLLAFARKQTVAPKVLDLNETIEGMLKMLRRLIGEDVNLAWRPGRDLGPVRIDPTQIDQILVNLCVNARDAMGESGKLTIETGNAYFDDEYCEENTGYMPGDYVRLAVSDNGRGMDADTLSHLFEPFFTTKKVGQGTGLGLATIYGIVKQNLGFISVYSEPGQGTTFKIYLPRHVAKAVLPPKKEVAASEAPGHETILLVEDDPTLLGMTRMMIERQGYTVLAAASPGEALRLAREQAGPIHLVVTDVVMPEMNGRDLVRNLLALYPDVKRLFMSGYTADVIAHHGVLDPGVHFIQKPFTMRDLGAKIAETLRSISDGETS